MSEGLEVATRVSTVDGSQDPYDHEICLIDSVEPDAARSNQPTPPRPAKKTAQTGIRDQLVQRKHARYLYERHSKTASLTTEQAAENGGRNGDDNDNDNNNNNNNNNNEGSATAVLEHGGHTNNAGNGNSIGTADEKMQKGSVAEIDVLYENQRGSFLWGMPLYSHSSLLNFDPAAWVTKDFKDSPVDITNAQVPDPTWEWAWKTWYVDMSYDVDEEGWQYSFAFGNRFAWHGNHPWFHSFVRRRRWLRKRIKTGHGPHSSKMNALSTAHDLNTDYFTIHQARELSPTSSVPDGYIGQPEDEADEPPEDLRNIGNLLQALKLAHIDREKIEIVKKFIDDGGPDLVYLKDAIPEIMSFFLFQNSKQQFLGYLEQAVKDAKKECDEKHGKDDLTVGEATEKQRLDILLAATEAVNKEVNGLDYWSDRQPVLTATQPKAGKAMGKTNSISSVAQVNVRPPNWNAVETGASMQLPSASQKTDKGNDKNKGKGKEQADP